MDTKNALSFMPVRLNAWDAAMNSHSFALRSQLSRADVYLAHMMRGYCTLLGTCSHFSCHVAYTACIFLPTSSVRSPGVDLIERVCRRFI
jgi:hypothetical protein